MRGPYLFAMHVSSRGESVIFRFRGFPLVLLLNNLKGLSCVVNSWTFSFSEASFVISQLSRYYRSLLRNEVESCHFYLHY